MVVSWNCCHASASSKKELYLAHPADYGNEAVYQDGVAIAQWLRTADPLWKDSLFQL
jgi:hypothetical protein